MTRTINSPIQVPAPQAMAAAPIVASKNSGGGQRQFLVWNSLYEQKRGTLFSDYDPLTLFSLDDNVTIRYRSKTLGGGGLTDETAECWLLVLAEETSPGSGAGVITFTQGAQTATWTFSTDLSTGGGTWVQTAANLTLDDSSTGYNTITVAITTTTGMDTLIVYGVACFYARDKTEMTAVSAASAAYANNGIVPIDNTRLDTDAPLTTSRLHHAHKCAEHLYENRVGQVCSTAYARSAYTATTALTFFLDVPHGVTQVRLYFYAGGSSGTLTITTWDGIGSVQISPLTSTDWYTADLTVASIADHRDDFQQRISIKPESCTIYSVCAWLLDAAFPYR